MAYLGWVTAIYLTNICTRSKGGSLEIVEFVRRVMGSVIRMLGYCASPKSIVTTSMVTTSMKKLGKAIGVAAAPVDWLYSFATSSAGILIFA